MNFFISYDISDDKRRTRLSNLLLQSGCQRVQKSVFFASDFGRSEMLRLKTRIETLLTVRYTEGGTPDDSVLYIPLDNDALEEVIWQGQKEKWIGLIKKDNSKFF